MSKSRLQKIAQTLQVTAYLDYRDYLAALYERAKTAFEPYSYLIFAQDLGFSAINMLRLVIARERQLSPESGRVIVKTLGLKKAERKYFMAMIHHINARGPALRERYFRKMIAAKQESIVSYMDKNQMAYYSSWQNAVINEMLRLDGVPKTPAALAASLLLPINEEKVRKSLALLESIGLVKADPATGEPRRLTDSPMILPSDVTAGHLSIALYHQAMLELAKEALAKVPADQREFNAMTVCLSTEGFKRLADKLRQACAEVLAVESEEQPRDLVAQFNVQLFTLTKWGPS